MVSRSVIAQKLRMAQEKREAKLKQFTVNRKTSGHIRPRKIKTNPPVKQPLYVDTKYTVKDVKKEFRRRMERNLWSSHPLLPQIVPYRKGVEAEYKLVLWVERGIHPYSGKNIGPAANRSVFDYMTDHQLNLAIRISNEYKLKTK